LRVLVPVTSAVVGIDLADQTQMVVVTDHDSKVFGTEDIQVPRLGPGYGAGPGERAGFRTRPRRGAGPSRRRRTIRRTEDTETHPPRVRPRPRFADTPGVGSAGDLKRQFTPLARELTPPSRRIGTVPFGTYNWRRW